jgi:outer membrane protein
MNFRSQTSVLTVLTAVGISTLGFVSRAAEKEADVPSFILPAKPSVIPSFTASPPPEVSSGPKPKASGAINLAPSPLAEEMDLPDVNPIELPDLTLDKNGGINLSLEESVEIAIQTATSVLKAQNDVMSTGAQLLQAYGQFLPNLGATANYTYSNGSVFLSQSSPQLVHGSSTGAGYNITSDLNLFNGLADYSGLRSALLKKDASQLTLYRAKQQIALDIAQSFLQVVLDDKLVEINRKNLQESQERERLLQEQTKVGVRSLADLFRQQAETAQDESLLLTAENKTRQDQILFLKKLRADISKKYHFVEPPLSEGDPAGKVDPRYKNESALMKSALTNRTDLKAADNQANAAHWDVKVNWASYLPKLNLVGSMISGGAYLNSTTANGATITPPEQSNLGYQLGTQIDWQIGLQLSWTLFDRFQTHENVVKAEVVADNSQLDAQDERNTVEGDVRQAYGNYLTAVQQLRASKKGLSAAQKAYEVVDGRYQVGSANFVDLITAQAALVQAESTRAQALIDFQISDRTIEFAVGETRIERPTATY